MAIKRGLHKKLAEVGKIKTGYKGKTVMSKNGNEFRPPKKLDYFVITTTERDSETGNLIANKELMTRLGEKPRELRVRLPFDSIDKNFFTQFQAYHGGKKICAGDGETADRRGDADIKGGKLVVPGDINTVTQVDCNFEKCPIAQAGKCKVSGILSVFLPESGDFGGVYKYRTHSWNAVSSILGALEFFSENTGGILQGMPLKLVMVKKTTEEHGTIAYATLVLDAEELHGLRRLAIEEKQSRLAVGYDVKVAEAEAEAQGFFADTDPEEEIEAEFYGEDEEEPETESKPQKGTSSEDVKGALEKKRTARSTDSPVKERPEPTTEPPDTREAQSNSDSKPTEQSVESTSSSPAQGSPTGEKTDDSEGDELDIF